MKRLFILSFLFISTLVSAQDFEVPKDYSFLELEDYENQRNNVIKAVNWVENTPINEQVVKRKKVNTFLTEWLTGSTDVRINLDQDVVTFMDCSDCLMIFMGSWARYALVNKDYNNDFKGNLSGIESVINLYLKNQKTLGNIRAVEKYIKQKNKGNLENYIKTKI
jgi:hypothetical protein